MPGGPASGSCCVTVTPARGSSAYNCRMTATGGTWRRIAPALIVVLAALGIAGCAPAVDRAEVVPAATGKAITNLAVVNGVERSFTVRVPTEASTDLRPAVILLHGASGNGARMESVTGMSAIAEADGFVVAYPDGTDIGEPVGGLAWNAGACCGRPVRAEVDDVAFVSAVIDELVTNQAVDPERVFLAGFSNGGMLSYRAACELGEKIAGIAVVSGALNVQCAGESPMSVLIVHGTADPTVPYAGGPPSEDAADRLGGWINASVDDASAFWAERDGCEAHSIVSDTDGVSRDTWTGCTDGTSLDVVSIAGFGHRWPKTGNSGLDASALITEYFALQ